MRTIDDTLDAMEAEERDAERAGGVLGVAESAPVERVDRPPVELEPREPIIFDLRRHVAAIGGAAPVLDGVLGGARRPLLVCHGMTPFVPAGEKPARVCALGYAARLVGNVGQTLQLVPDTRFLEVASLDAKLELGVDAAGGVATPPIALPVGPPLLELGPVSVAATTSDRFVLSLRLLWSVLDVQAGPLAGGGARWNLYQRRDRLDRYQPLVQIVLVPDEVRALEFAVTTWVKVSARFFGKDRVWEWKERRFTHSLEEGK